MARNNPQAALITGPGVRHTLTLTADNNLQQITQVYNQGGSVTPTLADLQNFSVAWNTQNLAPLQAVLPTDVTFTSASTAEVWYGVTPTYVATYTGGVVGGVAGGHHPLEVAVSAIWRTGLKGQHGRGRLQFPDIPISFVAPTTDPNSLTPGAITAYLAAITALLTPLVTTLGTWTPVVQQRPLAPATISQRATAIVSFTLNHQLGTQRRRKLGRGI